MHYKISGELQDTFTIDKPKVIFCQREKAFDVVKATKNLNLESQIVTFDGKTTIENVWNLNEFLLKSGYDWDVNNFR